MSGVVGLVKAVIGQVFVVSPDGSQRLLIEGDRIFEGEQVLTGAAGAVTLSLADGKTLDLGRDTVWDANGITLPAASEQSDVAALQQAIADGMDPTQTLDPTAAGPQAGASGGGTPGAGGAHTHVVLDLTGEIIDPNAGYPTIGLDFPDDAPV
ncbi:retention module-containing protein, partial [Atlantibacter subterraneus]